MNNDLVLRGFWFLILSLALAWGVYRSDKQDRDPAPPEKGCQRYTPVLPALLLPMLLLFIGGFLLLTEGPAGTLRLLSAICFPIFFSISVYYAVLLPVLPLLRRRISARTCALLWLLPNYLYYANYSFTELRSPRWVISLPVSIAAVGAVWAAGFFAVLGWKVVGHLRFRHFLLKDARPAENPDWQALWGRELENTGYQKVNRALLISPAAATPLSIGLFLRTTQVVLPEQTYTPEELALILRHELVHISRRDSASKFFLAFCTAMCWFNPLMWLAMERSAQDLELSCDETVLLEADDDTRRRYAGLLLATAGDSRGFTTCLSASAQALRYRLRSVVHPVRRSGGVLLTGMVMFVLMMTCGYTALAYNPLSGQEAFFSNGQPEDYTLRSVRWNDHFRGWTCRCDDPDVLTARLGELELTQLTGNYTLSEIYPSLEVCYEGPDGTFWVELHERTLRVTPMGKASREMENTYYLSEGADLDALAELIVFLDE